MLAVSRNIVKTDEYCDIANEMCMYLLEMPEEKQKRLVDTGSVIPYFAKMVKQSAHSATSKYQWKYNPHMYMGLQFDSLSDEKDVPEHTQQYDTFFDEIEKAIESELDWFEKRIWKIHVSGVSFKRMSVETRIPTTFLFNTFSISKQKIKNKLQYGRHDGRGQEVR